MRSLAVPGEHDRHVGEVGRHVVDVGEGAHLGAVAVHLEGLAAERRAAEDTIQQQDVPAGYRAYILKYFDGIQPQSQDAEGK